MAAPYDISQITLCIMVSCLLEAWIKWERDEEGLWEVPVLSSNEDNNLPIKSISWSLFFFFF